MALRQSTTAIGNSTSPSATFASATVSGNLLIGLMAMQASRVISASPSGWSPRQTHQFANGGVVTAGLADKISDGTETSVTWTATSGTGWSVAIEEHDDVVSSYDTSAVDASNVGTVVTSQPSGSATNSAANALVIAAFVSQNGNNTDGGRAFTNSFTETTMAGGGGGTARPMALLARKVVSASASQSCTFSTTDTGDEMWGALSIYSLTGGGGGSSTVTDLTAAALSFSAKSLQASLVSRFSSALLSFSAKAIQPRLSATLSSPSIGMSANSIQPRLSTPLSSASFNFVAHAITTTGAFVTELAAAALSLVAGPIQPLLRQTLTSETLSMMAGALTFKVNTTIQLSAAAFRFAAKPITTSAAAIIRFTYNVLRGVTKAIIRSVIK